MSGVRVLVGTRKGAFVLTSDGKRDRWEVSGPHFAGLGDLPSQGLAGRPEPALRVAVERLVRADDPALRRRRRDLGAGRQRVRLRRRARAPTMWYDGTQHPWEFARVWHLEPSLTDPDTVYAGVEDAALFRSTDGGRTWQRALRPARPRLGPVLAAGRRRDVPAHDPAGSDRTPSGSSSRSRRRARSGPTTAARPGGRSTRACKSEDIPDPNAEVGHCVHRIAMHPSRPERAVHAEALGRDAQRRRRRLVARGQRQPADRLRLPDRRPRPRAGDHLRRPDQERLRSTSRPRASSACTAAGRAATSGRR